MLPAANACSVNILLKNTVPRPSPIGLLGVVYAALQRQMYVIHTFHVWCRKLHCNAGVPTAVMSPKYSMEPIYSILSEYLLKYAMHGVKLYSFHEIIISAKARVSDLVYVVDYYVLFHYRFCFY